MKNSILAVSFFLLSTGVASAQVTFTPRVGHSYQDLKFEARSYDFDTEVASSQASRLYSNSARFTLEVGYRLNESSEIVYDIGYSPYDEVPGLKANFMTYDLAFRQHCGDFYAQAGLGVQTLKIGDFKGSSSQLYTTPTFGIAAGYIWKFSSLMAADVSYHGYRSIAQSEADQVKDGTVRTNTKLVDVENHELALGLRFTF